MSRCARLTYAFLPMMTAGLLTAASASAQATGPDQIPKVLLQGLPQPKETYLATQLKPIRAHGTDALRIDQAAIASIQMDGEARARGQIAGKILSLDRDGNGRITAKEVRQSPNLRRMKNRPGRTPEQIRKQLARTLASEMEADADKNGVITLPEILAFANAKAKIQGSQKTKHLSELLALDPSGDGVLTVAEVEALALATYARFDSNGNGLIDGEEVTAVSQAKNAAKAVARATPSESELMSCTLPAAANNAEVFVLSAAQGDSASPVSVAGPDGVTSVATLAIEPGATPIYVVATANSGVVWRIEGAVSRIDRMVVVPHDGKEGPGAGVVGLPSDKVTFLSPGACYRSFVNPDGGKGRRALAIVEASLGHPVKAVIGARKLMHTALPSAKIINRATVKDSAKGHKLHARKPPEGIDHQIWRGMINGFPGGIAQFDVQDVIAPGAVVAYEVLPSYAGLVDLIKQGAIRRLEDGYLHIQKPIPRYPAGLARINMNILLGMGIPEPAGGSKSMCVISGDTGRPLHRSRGCSY